MTLPDYITAYLDEQGISADPLATFATLRLDQLDVQEIALLIEEHTRRFVPDTVFEAWATLADAATTAALFEREAA